MKRKKVTLAIKRNRGAQGKGDSKYAKKGTENLDKKTITIKATGHQLKIHRDADTRALEGKIQ